MRIDIVVSVLSESKNHLEASIEEHNLKTLLVSCCMRWVTKNSP